MKPMNRRLTCLIPLILSLIVACTKAKEPVASSGAVDLASASMEKVVAVYFEELEKLPGLFKQIQDEASAKATGPLLKAATDRLQACVDRLESWDKQQVGMAMAAQAQRFMNLQQAMMPELARISSNPALATHLQTSLRIPTVR